jgi:hypothetical protein
MEINSYSEDEDMGFCLFGGNSPPIVDRNMSLEEKGEKLNKELEQTFDYLNCETKTGKFIEINSYSEDEDMGFCLFDGDSLPIADSNMLLEINVPREDKPDAVEKSIFDAWKELAHFLMSKIKTSWSTEHQLKSFLVQVLMVSF